MRLRIDRTEEAGLLTIRVEGWLESDGIEELRRACEGDLRHMRLDLSEVRTADPRALDALLDLADAGAMLVGVPPYIQLLLGTRKRQRTPKSGGGQP